MRSERFCASKCTSAAITSVEIVVGELAMFSARLQGCLFPHAISPD